jgi:UDPglucose 6-dehydrogenase
VTFDTPVDENDFADTEVVARQIRSIFSYLVDGTLVLISSQVPVGFTARMEAEFHAAFPDRQVSFAYSPENLRLGKSLDVFRGSERIIIGVRNAADRPRLGELFGKFCGCLEWMAVESAELTKHALNAFLANSIAFINEIATLAEYAGADAKEVERGLKSDIRIGPRAYLNPGAPFGGGTLGRDVSYLAALATTADLSAPLLKAINPSNTAHKEWSRRKLLQLLGHLEGRKIAVLGLTYKPGTNTLRRSVAVELCQWLTRQGAAVRAYDPAIRKLPPELKKFIRLCHTIRDALDAADALVIATEWPEFQHISCDDLGSMRGRVIADPNRFLKPRVRHEDGSIYAAVGSHAE